MTFIEVYAAIVTGVLVICARGWYLAHQSLVALANAELHQWLAAKKQIRAALGLS